MSVPKVLVVGSGGVGAIAALSLHLNKKCEVTLVVRSDYEHVVNHGYEIDSVTYGKFMNWKPTHVSKNVHDAYRDHGEFDFIVVTTKNIPDGAITCEDIIRPAVTPKSTTIVLIQNGIDIETPMHEQFPGNVVLSGVSLIGSSNINCKVNNLHKDQLTLGVFENPDDTSDEYIERSTEKLNQFYDLYQNADESINKVTIDKNVKRSRWEKLVYNSVLNTITAIVNLDVNRCQIAVQNEDLFLPAMDEIIAIAASEGVVVDKSQKDKFIHIGDGLFYSPSMCIDQRKGQLMELEIILGNPIKIARKNNVPTPILLVIYHLLHMVQFRIKEKNGLIKINQDDFKNMKSDDYPAHFAKK